MKTNENWPEIVDTLRPYTNGSPAKGRRLKDIENCLRFLGWRKTNGTMSACTTPEENSGEPVIVLSKRNGRTGLQRFPVMTESPDSMAYTAGLYIGENIRLYYRPGEETDRPVCVLTVKLREDDANGPVLCDLLSYKEFDLKSMENLLPEHVNLELVDGRLTFCLYRFHKWPDYELLWLPLEFTERLGPPVRRVVLEFIRRFIRHHRMDDLKGTYYYDMTEDYMERCTDDPDEYTPDDRRRITRLMASYDDGKIARLLKRMRGRAFCTGLEDGLESCRPQTDGERKLLELVREGMTLMGKGVPCIMDYQYDWIYEKEPDFMPAPLESQILLAYSTNDEIVRDMMSTFNVDMQESYNLTPVSTMLLTPETDRIFSMDDFPERFAGWFNRFVHHATHKI